MPASVCQVSHGVSPLAASDHLDDEENFLVESLAITASREEQLFVDIDGCVDGVRQFNPTMEFAMEGKPLAQAATDFTDVHPSTEVNTSGTGAFPFVNFSAERFGHDPAEGKCIVKDVGSNVQRGEQFVTQTANITHYPHIA